MQAHPSQTHARTPAPLARLWRASLLFALLAASAAALWVAVPTGIASLQTMKVRWQLDQWTSGAAPAPGIVEWGNARNQIADALQTTPNDPNLHEGLAFLYATQAQANAAIPQLATSYMQQALASYQTAAQLRPMSGTTWANIALAHHALAGTQPPSPQTWQAFDKALSYGQREPSVQRTLAHIGFSRWANMPEPTRNTFLAMLQSVQPHNLAAMQTIAQRHQRTNLLPPSPAPAHTAPQ